MRLIYRHVKLVASFLLLLICGEILAPVGAYALTGGPSQPEVQGFEPVGTSEMVDLFSGDFNYNIPLLDIEGYPINIAYHSSGVTNDAEASWVGLGWSLNPGVINRSMRGVPDDFFGDTYEKEQNMRPNFTVGANGSIGGEAFGIKGVGLNYSLGVTYNNYEGIGFEQGLSLSYTVGDKSKGALNGSIGLSASKNGAEISPSLSYTKEVTDKNGKIVESSDAKIGASFNSREGLKQVSMSAHNNSPSISEAVSIGLKSYTPAMSVSMVNTSLTASFKPGTDFYGIDFTFDIGGYASFQRIQDKRISYPGYGYMFSEQASLTDEREKVTLDFNRENDGAYTPNTPNLPLTKLTYDLFSVSGQGVGGTYRPFRSDIGYVYDGRFSNISISGSYTGELSTGNLVKVGGDISVTDVNTYSNKWVDNNPAALLLKYRKNIGAPLYENYCLKQIGELSVEEDPIYEAFGGADPIRHNLTDGPDLKIQTTTSFTKINPDKSVIRYGIPVVNYRQNRFKRTQPVQVLNRKEASIFGLINPDSRCFNAKETHISEITVNSNDGSRYVYSIPAYNTLQEEITFNTGLKDEDDAVRLKSSDNALVEYTNEDNSLKNKRGVDNYYSKVKTPPYAHSYLLTAVLSSDYVDVDETKGPSEGDIGNYTYFQYDRAHANYKWRVPYEQFNASHNEGLKSDVSDDKANIIYGEKEIWYLTRIETKNYVAIFTLEDRADGFGVLDKNGGRGTQPVKLLRKITLYVKADLAANQNNPSLVSPVKEVHFEYNYSLCPNVPNNSGQIINVDGVNINQNKGKLTLKRIYFTYGKSFRGKYNPYVFNYNEDITDGSGKRIYNPDYNLKAYDRWGSYKPMPQNASMQSNAQTIHPSEFPYTNQDNQADADIYTSVWCMRQVILPSGGKISITYESDDYSYVQDKRATDMFHIEAFSPYKPSDNDYNSTILSASVNKYMPQLLMRENINIMAPQNNNILYFKLRNTISSTNPAEANEIFYERYIKGLPNLAFRFMVDITKSSDYEFITGFSDIQSYGLASAPGSAGFYTHGWIELKNVPIGDKASSAIVNPICKAAWQFARLYQPKKAWGIPDPAEDGGFETLIKALAQASLYAKVVELFLGPNGSLHAKDFGKYAIPAKSTIRLQNPLCKKLGGGSRVKKIELSDEWENMTSSNYTGTTANYGQEYTYTKIDDNGTLISSGVAANEPEVGAEESPLRNPIFFGDKEEKWLAPDDRFYHDGPLGSSFYPGPGVGYSRVEVQNLNRPGVTKHATGKVVHEFYTARDFPVIVKETDLAPYKRKSELAFRLLKLRTQENMAVSQGFTIELNDMHGKPKAQFVYAEGNPQPISGVEYKYIADPHLTNSFRLNNVAKIVYPDGKVQDKEIGVEYDVVSDFRENRTEMISGSTQANLANFLLGSIFVSIPTGLPGISVENTSFRSATVTKVINRYGLIKEVIAYDLGHKVSTENLAYDSETGGVLLTKTKNEFEDDIYNLNLPAHWYYKGMSAAYKNIGATFSSVNISAGIASINNASSIFVPGDELLINNSTKGWVTETNGNNITIVNIMGNAITTTNSSVKIIRSGRRNLLGASMGSITTLVNPLDHIANNGYFNVIAAGVQEYKDDWGTFCECFTNPSALMRASSNPYINGTKGVWRPFRSRTFLSNRELSYKNKNTNIRRDGTFISFSPFWRLNNGVWTQNPTSWTWVSEITIYSPFSVELENKDALNRYSSAVYGYGQMNAIGVAANAAYKEIGFDGFEDYDFRSCTDDHFGYKPFKSNITGEVFHTGRRSIKVNQSDNISITKTLTPCN